MLAFMDSGFLQGRLIPVVKALVINFLFAINAQSANLRGQPAPLILRSAAGSPSLSTISNSPYIFYQNDRGPPSTGVGTTFPPTELRITYPQESFGSTPEFPSRIRFWQSRNHDLHNITLSDSGRTGKTVPPEKYNANFVRPGEISPGPPEIARSHLENLPENRETDTEMPSSSALQIGSESDALNSTYLSLGDIYNRTGLLNSSSLLLMRSSLDANQVFPDSAGITENKGSNSYSVGSITIGGLIGIITGILTVMVLAIAIGIVCYRHRHPTWNTAETDLRVLATHYGSYWDDKTLPRYQFNDRMTWPGETHEEMIALDNDAFLKSLEDLGRVSSRPNSKNNWNQEEPIDSQRQSTKV